MRTETWNGYTIRFVEHNGEWWAVLADIAKALDLNPKFIKQRLGDEVVSNNHVADSLGRQQEMLIVNEFGIYETIFSSRKKEAKTFKLWVFETIKQLRQSTGLEGFQVFRMFDKEHQKQAMNRLVNGLEQVKQTDLIKANTIANKAVSNKYGLPKMISKSQMTEQMLKDREQLLDDRTAQLLNNGLRLVGQDLKDVLSARANSINPSIEKQILYIMIDRANTGEWLANVDKK